jgi:2-succinyl-5-enolpyruvyl-6-hydroxy-3-cyclohexene-1-carboxylate synthase
MPIQFSNVNTIWASVLVETLYRLGLTTAIICPGSRSAPLAIAFAQHPGVEALPILDERSAAFFGLGLARRSGQPIALVCTSGTAGANFYPAIIEARESRIPLLVLTADRPPELRDCNAGQTVDQQKLYGTFPNWYSELAVPELDLGRLAYLRQTLIYAWERSLYPGAGVVHLNLPFRDPLAPVEQPDAKAFSQTFPANFFSHLSLSSPSSSPPSPFSFPLPASDRGLIVAGLAQPQLPRAYCQAIADLSKMLQVPVLAEGLSPLRNYAALNPRLVSTYDLILRHPERADKLAPDWIIRVGEMSTSKTLRQWLSQAQPQQWIVDPTDRNLDPLHGNTMHLRLSVEDFTALIAADIAAPPSSAYLSLWQTFEAQTRQNLDQALDSQATLFEGKIAWLLSQYLPVETPLFIANSTPVRDVEFFWQPNNRGIRPYFNRGANGIDGTLSTALGVAHRNQSSILLTGDLALLHDTNGGLVSHKLQGHLTIVLINNRGGGIFESLPVAGFDPPFEEFFATPQSVDFARFCQTYGIEYELIQSWQHLTERVSHLPDRGVRLLEVQCHRKTDVQTRRAIFARCIMALRA